MGSIRITDDEGLVLEVTRDGAEYLRSKVRMHQKLEQVHEFILGEADPFPIKVIEPEYTLEDKMNDEWANRERDEETGEWRNGP